MPIHYPPLKIGELKDQLRACFVGEVKKVGEGRFLISDGSGELEFRCEKELKEGWKRIFCRREGGEWVAEVVQDLEGIDLNLFKKVEELYRREGLYV